MFFMDATITENNFSSYTGNCFQRNSLPIFVVSNLYSFKDYFPCHKGIIMTMAKTPVQQSTSQNQSLRVVGYFCCNPVQPEMLNDTCHPLTSNMAVLQQDSKDTITQLQTHTINKLVMSGFLLLSFALSRY